MKALLILLGFLFLCQFSQAQGGFNLMAGSEKYIEVIHLAYSDSFCYHYRDYRITVYHPSTTDGFIRIVDSKNQTRTLVTDDTTYFYGIMNHKMVIDNGTSSIRMLSVYDLETMDLIFSSSYKDQIIAKGQTIEYDFPISYSDEPFIRPDCPEKKQIEDSDGVVGYIEPRDYKVDTNEVIKAGPIRCVFFE
ncbi:MAG TPA: hypothetical protein VGK10_07485 [Prolixibacteraceae bacterium]